MFGKVPVKLVFTLLTKVPCSIILTLVTHSMPKAAIEGTTGGMFITFTF